MVHSDRMKHVYLIPFLILRYIKYEVSSQESCRCDESLPKVVVDRDNENLYSTTTPQTPDRDEVNRREVSSQHDIVVYYESMKRDLKIKPRCVFIFNWIKKKRRPRANNVTLKRYGVVYYESMKRNLI